MVLALAAMASVATPVSGSPAPVTMESAMHEVLSWHPSVVQAAATLDARGEDVTIARAGYLPRISAGVGSGYDSRLGSIWRPRPQLSASQMLYDFGKVARAVDYARAGTRLGRADMLLAIDGLIRDTGYAMVEVQRNAAIIRPCKQRNVDHLLFKATRYFMIAASSLVTTRTMPSRSRLTH